VKAAAALPSSLGTMVAPAERIAERFDATLVNMRFISRWTRTDRAPGGTACLHSSASRRTRLPAAPGRRRELLAAARHTNTLDHLGIPDRLVEHGSREDCLKMAGLDALALETAVGAILAAARPRPGRARLCLKIDPRLWVLREPPSSPAYNPPPLEVTRET